MKLIILGHLLISRKSFGKAYEDFGNRELLNINYKDDEQRKRTDSYTGAMLELFRRYLWDEYDPGWRG